MSKAEETARAILAAAQEAGFTVSVRPNNVMVIEKRLGMDRQKDFVDADMSYGSILSLMPRTSPGSDWGTDGGGVGAISAMNSGVFRMHRSGCSARVVSALKRLQRSA